MSHSARSAWIETVTYGADLPADKSHSARSAWIETIWMTQNNYTTLVALRKECVD